MRLRQARDDWPARHWPDWLFTPPRPRLFADRIERPDGTLREWADRCDAFRRVRRLDARTFRAMLGDDPRWHGCRGSVDHLW